jgi:hypothetical protein
MSLVASAQRQEIDIGMYLERWQSSTSVHLPLWLNASMSCLMLANSIATAFAL